MKIRIEQSGERKGVNSLSQPGVDTLPWGPHPALLLWLTSPKRKWLCSLQNHWVWECFRPMPWFPFWDPKGQGVCFEVSFCIQLKKKKKIKWNNFALSELRGISQQFLPQEPVPRKFDSQSSGRQRGDRDAAPPTAAALLTIRCGDSVSTVRKRKLCPSLLKTKGGSSSLGYLSASKISHFNETP